MRKKIITLTVAVGMMLMPMQGFAQTYNYISSVTETKEDKAFSTQIVIDNEHREVYEGEYITISLENAKFDFDKNDRVKIRSNGLDFNKGSNRRINGQVTERGASSDEITITFYSEALGGEAIVKVEGEGSGISSGEYVYATTGEASGDFKGKVKNNFPVYFDGSLEAEPIIIEEPHGGIFRSLENSNQKEEPLLTLKIIGDSYEFRNMGGHDTFEMEVHDGKDNSKRYKIGIGEELKLDNSLTKLTFKKDYDTIFEGGRLYRLELKNIQIAPTKDHVKGSDIEVEFGGLLVEKQKTTLASQSAEDIMLETSKADLKPGKTQSIKFKVEEGIPNTLFKEGYISLGLYGGALIDSATSLKFKLKEGDHTYTQEDKKVFKIERDSIGDRITIKDYRRKDKKALLSLEGTLEVSIPERTTNDIELFINEPSLSKASVKTVLTGTDKPEKPIEPEKPEVSDKPLEPTGPKVTFQIDNNTYTVGSMSYLLDMKPYISPHDRIMVPLRYVAYALGVDIEDLKWNGPSQTITLEGDKAMTINVTTGQMVIDGETSTLSETRLLNGRTFVPVGEIGKAFGVPINWDAETRTATFN